METQPQQSLVSTRSRATLVPQISLSSLTAADIPLENPAGSLTPRSEQVFGTHGVSLEDLGGFDLDAELKENPDLSETIITMRQRHRTKRAQGFTLLFSLFDLITTSFCSIV